jgi:hypothetical protein
MGFIAHSRSFLCVGGVWSCCGVVWCFDLVVSAHEGGLAGVWAEKKQVYRLGVCP